MEGSEPDPGAGAPGAPEDAPPPDEGREGPVIAIDGPAGSGKSTLARRLAIALDLPYVNTGAMYRALAREAVDRGVDPDAERRLVGLLGNIGFALGGSDPVELLVNGRVPGEELQSADVEAIVSAAARHPTVRAWMRDRQRALGWQGAVMEGRDIASAVFPDAELKIFLSAPLDVRAERRASERSTSGGGATIAPAVADRDSRDARTNPLEAVPDAHLIDTRSLDADGVFDAAMAIVAHSGLSGSGSARDGAARPSTTKVAIVGRQNVGKSTLLNRLLGRKVAIAHAMPGVTRDRLEVDVTWEGRTFVLVDTGGFAQDATGIELSVSSQAQRAAAEADLVLLVVDATTGVQEEDSTLATRLHRANIPTLVVANKVDAERQEAAASEFLALGFGEPMLVSALHGRGSGDLLDEIVAHLPAGGEPSPEGEARFAIVGKPNVGKSSLFNRLIAEERSVVHDEPGTTRDAVDSIIEHEGLNLRFIDTAGLRRRTKTQGVEFYGLLRTERAIEGADVALMVIDATQGLTSEDKRIASDVAAAGRGLVVALNKWDLIDTDERDHLFKFIRGELRAFPGAPVLRTSAATGSGVGRILPALLDVHERWLRRAPTAEVNRVVERLAARHPPPRTAGRVRYVTQVGAGPPHFVVFGMRDPGPQYRRYLENALRTEFGFDGVPVRLSFRTRESGTAARSGTGGNRRRTGRGGDGGR
jgi:GTP-binding protein